MIERIVYLKGPEVTAWLRAQGIRVPEPEGDDQESRTMRSDRRAIRRWANGGAADERVVDRVLTRAGRHLSELPAECHGGAFARSRYEPEFIDEVIEAYHDAPRGEKQAVARTYDVPASTVYAWAASV